MSNSLAEAKFPPFTLLDEPLLSFSPENKESVDPHPLRGLVRFGPYTSSVFKAYTPQLRVAVVCPQSNWRQVGELMKTLQVSHRPGDRKEYVPDYSGFHNLFGIPIISAEPKAHIKWDDNLGTSNNVEEQQAYLLSQLKNAMEHFSLVRDLFDVVVVHLPDKWSPVCKTSKFDAHDTLKALGAYYSIPTQVINDRSFSFNYKASIAWRLGIALYVKAGGTPWKLAPLAGIPDDTAYIGLAYALKKVSEESHYVTCCSQVFDMDGGGMQFVAFEARDPVRDIDEAKRNPFLSRDDMRAVLARSLNLYQSRNGGALPKRLVIHKTTAFKDEEIEGALDALHGVKEVECVEIGSKSAWRGVWLVKSDNNKNKPVSSPTKPAGYPVPRGTVLLRTGSSALLWVAGNAPSVSSTGNYYQGKKSIPKPLLLTRHVGSGSLETMALEAMALTKMDWNNDALYDPVPVTIRYSQRLARTISNIPDLPGNTYPYRLFM